MVADLPGPHEQTMVAEISRTASGHAIAENESLVCIPPHDLHHDVPDGPRPRHQESFGHDVTTETPGHDHGHNYATHSLATLTSPASEEPFRGGFAQCLISPQEATDLSCTASATSPSFTKEETDELYRQVRAEQRAALEARLREDIQRTQEARKQEQRRPLPSDLSMELLEDLALLESDELEQLIANTVDEVTLQVAVDSGSCANVAHPDDMPKGAIIEPNTEDKHFSGAGGDRIKKYCTCKTKCVGSAGEFTTDWSCAEVTRALHSVSKIAGPEDHPTGYQDVLFNNRRCCVVPPGIVDLIMSKVKAVAEYKRSGGLYLADITLSSFARQGPAR